MIFYLLFLSTFMFFILLIYYKFDLVGSFLLLLMFFSVIIMLMNNHLFCLFLALEIQAFCSLILLASNSFSILSSEASMKYFIMSSFSSGFFLIGVYFIFSSSFNLNLAEMNLIQLSFWGLIGKILILFSLLLKTGSAPFHFWLMDFYESSSWIILMVVGMLPKMSYIYIMIKLMFESQYFIIMGLICLIMGCLGAFNQTKMKSLLAYSSVNHIGFYMIALILPFNMGDEVTLFYISIYLMTFLLLLSLCLLMNVKPYMIDLSGNQNKKKFLFIGLFLFLLSLAGLPPFAGFSMKLLVLWQFLMYNYIYISLFIMFFSILSMAFYLNLTSMSWFQDGENYNFWENLLLPSKKSFQNYQKLLIPAFGVFFSFFFIIIFDFFMIILNYSMFKCF